MSTANLLARMKALREREQTGISSPRSSDTSSVTLSTFLLLYNKAAKECYIEYSQGAKDLYRWLTFPSSPLDYEVNKFPLIDDPDWKVPATFTGYAQNELATLISGEAYGLEYRRAERAIALTTIDLVQRGLL